MELVIGTTNPGKLREYTTMLSQVPVRLLSVAEAGLESLEVEEDGITFEDNAQIKALAYAHASRRFTLADDSGLMVDALDGAPGLYSARYGNDPGLGDAGRRKKLLEALRGVPSEQRTARFVCAIALADPRTRTCVLTRGTIEGHITDKDADGPHGFGYDAIFMPEGYLSTFARLAAEIKNDLSHRGMALRLMLPHLHRLAEQQSI